MRTAPEHDRAALCADAVSLQDCAARLDALASDLPADRTPRGADALAVLAKRCRAAADDLAAVAVLFEDGFDRPESEDAFTQRSRPVLSLLRPPTADMFLGHALRGPSRPAGPA